jgi:hypothetical protein
MHVLGRKPSPLVRRVPELPRAPSQRERMPASVSRNSIRTRCRCPPGSPKPPLNPFRLPFGWRRNASQPVAALFWVFENASNALPRSFWVSEKGSQRVGSSFWVAESGSQPVQMPFWVAESAPNPFGCPSGSPRAAPNALGALSGFRERLPTRWKPWPGFPRAPSQRVGSPFWVSESRLPNALGTLAWVSEDAAPTRWKARLGFRERCANALETLPACA